jgi:hypothetical protein
MPENESSISIEELSHEISIEVLRRLKFMGKTERLSSGNYQCTGTGYTCGRNYKCPHTKDHSCIQFFECRDRFLEY